MKKIHYTGKAITMSEKEQNPYLYDYMWKHTECGLLFKKGEEDRVVWDKDFVTCKRCLKKLNEGILDRGEAERS